MVSFNWILQNIVFNGIITLFIMMALGYIAYKIYELFLTLKKKANQNNSPLEKYKTREEIIAEELAKVSPKAEEEKDNTWDKINKAAESLTQIP